MKSLAIMGASGHGKVVADIARLNGYENIIFVDANSELESLGQYQVMLEDDFVAQFDPSEYDVFVGIGNAAIRRKLQEKFESLGATIPTLIHPNATVADDVKIDSGTVIMAGAVVNPGTTIGKGCIINTCASVDHDNIIGDFAHISVSAHTAGTVVIGDNVWMGIGSIVSNNLSICADAFICAGAVVVKNIEVAGKYAGYPARKTIG